MNLFHLMLDDDDRRPIAAHDHTLRWSHARHAHFITRLICGSLPSVFSCGNLKQKRKGSFTG